MISKLNHIALIRKTGTLGQFDRRTGKMTIGARMENDTTFKIGNNMFFLPHCEMLCQALISFLLDHLPEELIKK